MQSLLSRGRHARIQNHESAPAQDAPLRPDEARAVASRLIAEGPRGQTPGRRPHRGQLPDVDPAMIVARPQRTGWLRRLFSRALRKPAVKAGKAAAKPPVLPSGMRPLGTRPPPTYIGVTEAGDPASFIATFAPQPAILSRAA